MAPRKSNTEASADAAFGWRARLERIVRIVKWILRPGIEQQTGALVVQRFANRIVPGYALPSPFVDWMSNEDWSAHFRRFGDSTHTAHRRFFLSNLVCSLDQVVGDTAEVGVFRGSSSALICHANRLAVKPRLHYVFDSFEGLSEPIGKDGNYWRSGDLAVEQDSLRLDETDGVYIVMKGWVPDRFPEVSTRTFAFVHIDVDLYEPTRSSLEFFSERMAPGGVILCDDYGSVFCPGATRAIDEFVTQGRLRAVQLPAGGCFIRFAEG